MAKTIRSRMRRDNAAGSEASSSQQYEEGGWGMVVLAASFTSEFIVYGNIKALGVFVSVISEQFETDIWITGWMVSMSLAIQYLTAPLLPPLLHRFGYRPVMLVSGVMVTAGYMLAAFSQSIATWSLCVVGLAGVGSGSFVYPLFSLLATYFKRCYPVTSIVSSLGMSFGTLLYGPLTQWFLDAYGWRWAMMLFAALTFHLVPVAAVAKASSFNRKKRQYEHVPRCVEDDVTVTQQTVRDDEPATEAGGNRRSKLLADFDFAILKDVHFILLTSASCVVAFCFVGWAVYVVPHGINQGLSKTQSSFLPTAFGAGNIVGKLTAALLLQKGLIGDRWVLSIGALMASVFFIVDSFLISFHGLLLVTMAIGIGNAISNAAKINLFRNITTEERVLSIYCWQGIFIGASDILAGFASGWFFEVTGTFTTTFIMFGVVQFLAVVFMLIDIAVVNCARSAQLTVTSV